MTLYPVKCLEKQILLFPLKCVFLIKYKAGLVGLLSSAGVNMSIIIK